MNPLAIAATAGVVCALAASPLRRSLGSATKAAAVAALAAGAGLLGNSELLLFLALVAALAASVAALPRFLGDARGGGLVACALSCGAGAVSLELSGAAHHAAFATGAAAGVMLAAASPAPKGVVPAFAAGISRAGVGLAVAVQVLITWAAMPS